MYFMLLKNAIKVWDDFTEAWNFVLKLSGKAQTLFLCLFIPQSQGLEFLNIEFTICSQPKAVQLAGHENVMADEKRKRERNFHNSARSIKQLGLLCVKDDAKRHSLKAWCTDNTIFPMNLRWDLQIEQYISAAANDSAIQESISAFYFTIVLRFD